MRDILLTSHGKMASGLKNTLELFMGESNNIKAVDAFLDSSDDYIYEISDFINNATDDNSIIFTDLYGGSVNQKVSELVYESNINIPIVTSMNLPIVLSIALSEEEITEELISNLIEECKPLLVKLEVKNTTDDDLINFLN